MPLCIDPNILGYIFTYFPWRARGYFLSTICREWNHAFHSHGHWLNTTLKVTIRSSGVVPLSEIVSVDIQTTQQHAQHILGRITCEGRNLEHLTVTLTPPTCKKRGGQQETDEGVFSNLGLLYQLPKLKTLHLITNKQLTTDIACIGLSDVGHSDTLRTLHLTLSDCMVSEVGATGLALLCKPPHLHTFRLTLRVNDQLTTAACKALAVGISRNSTELKSLYLDFSNSKVTTEAVGALSSLSNLSTLKTFACILRNNTLDALALPNLLKLRPPNIECLELDVSHQRLGGDGSYPLSHICEGLHTLKLNLQKCDVTDSVCCTLAMLGSSQVLQQIRCNLSENHITDTGVVTLSRLMLCTNLLIVDFDLSFNRISDHSMPSLCEWLAVERLQELRLNLQYNRLTHNCLHWLDNTFERRFAQTFTPRLSSNINMHVDNIDLMPLPDDDAQSVFSCVIDTASDISSLDMSTCKRYSSGGAGGVEGGRWSSGGGGGGSGGGGSSGGGRNSGGGGQSFGGGGEGRISMGSLASSKDSKAQHVAHVMPYLSMSQATSSQLKTVDIRLGSNDLGPSGCAHIRHFSRLTNIEHLMLNLSSSCLDDKAITCLDFLPSLQRLTTLQLWLQSNQIGAEGGCNLCVQLEHCTTLQSLCVDLSYNPLGASACAARLVHAIQKISQKQHSHHSTTGRPGRPPIDPSSPTCRSKRLVPIIHDWLHLSPQHCNTTDHHCYTNRLKHVYLKLNGIGLTDNHFTTLLKLFQLPSLCSLTLCLKDNSISDQAVVPCCEQLSQFALTTTKQKKEMWKRKTNGLPTVSIDSVVVGEQLERIFIELNGNPTTKKARLVASSLPPRIGYCAMRINLDSVNPDGGMSSPVVESRSAITTPISSPNNGAYKSGAGPSTPFSPSVYDVVSPTRQPLQHHEHEPHSSSNWCCFCKRKAKKRVAREIQLPPPTPLSFPVML